MASKGRNFFHAISEEKIPGLSGKSFAFTGKNEREFSKWREAFRHVLMTELKFPREKVPLRPEIIESASFKDYIREKVVYDLEDGLSAAAWICSPTRPTVRVEPARPFCISSAALSVSNATFGRRPFASV